MRPFIVIFVVFFVSVLVNICLAVNYLTSTNSINGNV